MRKKKLLSDYIIEDIKTMLCDGRLKEGDRLPNQIEFAEQLGVSRISLREALRRLEMMGIVSQKPKIGTVILNGNPDNWGSGKKIELTGKEDMRQMLQARKCVEMTIATEAANRITSEQLERLTEKYFEMYETFRKMDAEGYLAKDKEFHMLIAEAGGNKYLKSMYEVTLRHEDEFMKEIFTAQPEVFEKTVVPHRGIYEALAERSSEKINLALHQHSEFFENLIARFFERNEEARKGTLYYP